MRAGNSLYAVFLDNAIEQAAGAAVGIRITSYNVCYTKLLRSLGFGEDSVDLIVAQDV